MESSEKLSNALFEPGSTRYRPQVAMYKILLDYVPPELIFGFGSLIQLLSFLLLPFPFSLTPTLILFILPIVKQVLMVLGWVKNPYMSTIVPGDAIPVVPGTEVDGDGTLRPPRYSVALLGARSNAPLGLLDKEFRVITEDFTRMENNLWENPKSGLLTQVSIRFLENVETRDSTDAFGPDSPNDSAEWYLSINRGSQNAIVTMFYFKSTADVIRFAHEQVHSSAWGKWGKKDPERTGHVELWHEVFTVEEGASESVYINCQPRGLGSITEELTPGKWTSVLRRPEGKAKTSKGRMGGQVPGSRDF